MKGELALLVQQILKDIQVELADEFDRNFERQAFFSEAWQRRKSPIRQGRGLLVDTGRLRQSIQSRATEDSITFFTTEPYAGIHNEGGEIVVTARMKRFFWHKYYEAQGSFGRRKDGSARRDKRTVQLTEEAEFWKLLALMKVGSTIRIPRRRFLGVSPEVEKAVREIVEENVREYFQTEFKITGG
jgi:phage gpG-like protein